MLQFFATHCMYTDAIILTVILNSIIKYLSEIVQNFKSIKMYLK